MVINKTIVMAISLSNRSCPYEFNASIDCWLKTTSHYDVSIWWRHHGSMVIASSMRRKDSSYGLTFYTYRNGYWGRLMLLKMNRWVFPRNSQLSWITYIWWSFITKNMYHFSSKVDIDSNTNAGPRLNIKTVLSTYGDFHVKDKTAVRTSYL